jgi:hypothetical protein
MTDTKLQFPDAHLEEQKESYSAFAISQTFDSQLTLDVRLKTGVRIGLPYPWLARAEFNPPELILAFTTGVQVSIKGRNLTDVYAAIIRHQAVFICEADQATQLLTDAREAVIESIEVSR